MCIIIKALFYYSIVQYNTHRYYRNIVSMVLVQCKCKKVPGGKLEGLGGKLEGLGGKLEGLGGKLEGLGGKLEGLGGKWIVWGGSFPPAPPPTR